ncbi:MAG: multidrug transporter MdfA, partial [Legionellaceae bacterium]
GLAPVILVTVGKLSLIQYGVCQLPIFTAVILGNTTLRRMTHHHSVERLILMGSLTVGAGLLLMILLPLVFGASFVWLFPGLILYFFGLGIAGSPLSRFILFSTPVAKGTASALMSMVLMSLQAVGVEVVNKLYTSHDNAVFGLYCAGVGLIYGLVVWGAFYASKRKKISIV